MSLIIPTYEEHLQIEKERMSIINSIMQIQSVEELHILSVMANKYYADSIRDLPLPLDVFVDLLDLPILIRMADLFRKEDPDLWANKQIKELLAKAIDNYTGADDEEEKEKESA